MIEPTPQLIDLITKEVVNTLSAISGVRSKETVMQNICSKKNILVLGSRSKISEQLEGSCNLVPVEEYAKDGQIDKYNAVIITELSHANLADIALLRDDNPFPCAAIKAMLTRKKVYKLSNAEDYKKYNNANPNILKILKNYSQILKSFGIEEVDNVSLERICNKNICSSSSFANVTTGEKFISEQKAKELAKGDVKTVTFKKGIILSPLAKDVFSSAHIKIEFI